MMDIAFVLVVGAILLVSFCTFMIRKVVFEKKANELDFRMFFSVIGICAGCVVMMLNVGMWSFGGMFFGFGLGMAGFNNWAGTLPISDKR